MRKAAALLDGVVHPLMCHKVGKCLCTVYGQRVFCDSHQLRERNQLSRRFHKDVRAILAPIGTGN